MFQTKFNSPIHELINHGFKTAGSYSYILLIDVTGTLVLIERVKSDNSEILFYKKPANVGIADFFSDPTVYDANYTYFHLLS